MYKVCSENSSLTKQGRKQDREREEKQERVVGTRSQDASKPSTDGNWALRSIGQRGAMEGFGARRVLQSELCWRRKDGSQLLAGLTQARRRQD